MIKSEINFKLKVKVNKILAYILFSVGIDHSNPYIHSTTVLCDNIFLVTPISTISTYPKGCKTNNISVVYTEFGNLKKTQKMDVGQVGFHDDKKV